MSETASGSFGHYLQMTRVEKRIPLEEVARQTRISMDVLHAIENGDIEKLPAEVFVTGFLHAYARVVGADADVAVQRYRNRLRDLQDRQRAQRAFFRAGRRFGLRLLLVLVMLAVIVSLSVALVSRNFLRMPSQEPMGEELQTTAQPSAKPDRRTPKGRVGAETVSRPEKTRGAAAGVPTVTVDVPPAAGKAPFVLKVVAREDTWMKVIADDHKARKYRLHPGDRLELQALSGYNILIGSASGVKLTLNGQPVHVFGKRGQMVNMQLP